jgi:hypothetical protein
MPFSVEAIAGAIADVLPKNVPSVTLNFDATGMSEDEIRSLVESAKKASDVELKLRGVRVGADIFSVLGGAKGGWENAQYQGETPIVVDGNFGRIEFVFRK